MKISQKFLLANIFLILLLPLFKFQVDSQSCSIHWKNDEIYQKNTIIRGNNPSFPISVACVFAEGGIEDKSFNYMIYQGLQKAYIEGLCTFNYTVTDLSPDYLQRYKASLENYASSGNYDLLVAVGFDVPFIVDEVASSYPSQPIVLIDGIANQHTVRSVAFKANEASFLAGALAGLMTQTGKIGFIGGMDVSVVRELWAGYKAGALYKRNNSKIEVLEQFTGSFIDRPLAKSMAEYMWTAGVDIIFAAAGDSGLGVLESANEQGEGYFAIGVDADQDYLYPGRILCSVMKRMDVAVYKAIKDVQMGNWSGGEQKLGLADMAVSLSPLKYTKEKIGNEIIHEVNVTIREKIVSGKLSIPTDQGSLIKWMDEMNLGPSSISSTSMTSLTTTTPSSSTPTGESPGTIVPGLELLPLLAIFLLLIRFRSIYQTK